MAGEIKRQDIIEDDALMAPLVLAKNFETLLATITKLKGEVGANQKLAESATNINAVNTAVKNLSKQETELVKVQNALAASVAKDNEEYANMKKKLDDANASLKNRIQLGDQDAKTLDRQNASLVQLQAALVKNRQEYAKLTTEQARTSKTGQDLLKIIQRQDKDVKALNVSMGKHTDNVGNYSSAMQGLDGVMGGTIGRTQQLGQQFLALAKNPIVLILGTLVGLFAALKSSVTAFYTSTAEGEERLSKQKATWDAFFITLKHGWADVGKSVADFFGDDGLKGLFDSFLIIYFPKLWAQFQVTEKRSQDLNVALRKLTKDHADDVVDDANTELKVNLLIEKSRNKLKFSAEERIAALEQANDLRRVQLEGDIQLAEDDLAVFDKRMKLERVNGELLLADITERARLQAALTKVESDAAAARTARFKLEKALTDEIHKDNLDVLNAQFEKEMALNQQAVEDRIQLVREEVLAFKKTKVDGDKEIANIIKANAANLIEQQIAGLEKLMAATETNAEEDAEIAIKIAKLKIDLNKAVYDSLTTFDAATVESAKENTKSLYEIYQEFTSSLTSLFSSFSARRLQDIDDEIASLQESTDRQIEMAGDNDAAVAQIQAGAEIRREQLEKKKRADQQKSAINEKAASVISSLINTAVAITKALPNIPLAVLTGVLGAIQTAAIIAQPIPKFEKGTGNSPEGFAFVGEKGAELKVDPSGKTSLTPGVPTLDYLKAGTRIIPHDETMKMLALSSLGKDTLLQRQQSEQVELAKSLKQIEKNTRKLGQTTNNLFKQGSLVYEQKVREDKSREYIRRSNLGY